MNHNSLYLRQKIYVVVAFATLLVLSCTRQEDQLSSEEHRVEIEQWHTKRIEELKDTTGWLNLAGLYWLQEGINSFGSGERNQIVFPSGTIVEEAGYFLVKNKVVSMEVHPDVAIQVNRLDVRSIQLFHPDSTKAPVATYGSLQWFVIMRDNQVGVRLRDLASDAVRQFKGIERYPLDIEWRKRAVFHPTEGKTIDITNILGQTTAQTSPGALSFEHDGKDYSLDVLEGNKEEFFIIVGDETNETETYPAGRYLYVKKPNAKGEVILDFNKAYNPPCAFTTFATCPLPPKQNVLPLAIEAGEKKYENALHTEH